MKLLVDDTIAAVSTPIGTGGIGIIRISGLESLNIAKTLFDKKTFSSHKLYFGTVKYNGNILDECMITYMKAPKTYTREDVVEIHCHGGVKSLQKILEAILSNGARHAEPGEFTKRAFLNGRIDLVQAEAVMDIITSKTEAAHKSSLNHLGGSFSGVIEKMRNDILEIMAFIEMQIDYPEHADEESLDIEKRLNPIIEDLKKLYSTADMGKIIKAGVDAVILGRPNVGKSSFLNHLLDEERAIVTDIEGTTRDVLHEHICIHNIPIKIADTAGIRDSENEIEKMGVIRSMQHAEKADLIFLMIDGSRSLEDVDIELLELAAKKKAIVIINKIDRDRVIYKEDVLNYFHDSNKIIEVSIKEKIGIDHIYSILKDMFFSGDINLESDILITSTRHKIAIKNAVDSLERSLQCVLANDFTYDIIAIDLKDSYDFLGQITGETLEDDLIDKIFSLFCLGK